MNRIMPPKQEGGYWAAFPATYRAEQIATIAQWLATGDSGTVVGLSGSGKSNLAGFMAERPEVLSEKLPGAATAYCFPHLDMNSLPTMTTPSFYRAMLYALHAVAPQIDQKLVQGLAQVTTTSLSGEDPLALYLALQRAHALFVQDAGKKVIWLMDRFDEACRRLEAGALNSLRHLRDQSQLKGSVSFVVFTRQPLARLRNPADYDEFHEIMIPNICWVGPMVVRDAHWVLQQMAERHQTTLSPATVALLIELTGAWPAFLKAACTAFAQGQLPLRATVSEWAEQLSAQPLFLRHCQDLWDDCSQAERAVLLMIGNDGGYRGDDWDTVMVLEKAGVLTSPTVNRPRQIFSPIFAAFLKRQKIDQLRGITLNPQTNLVLRDGLPLQAELAPREQRLLLYFLQHSGEICDKDVLIDHIWGEEVSDENLTQLVKRLREKIEVSAPNHTYIQTIRGRGYRFMQPEG